MSFVHVIYYNVQYFIRALHYVAMIMLVEDNYRAISGCGLFYEEMCNK